MGGILCADLLAEACFSGVCEGGIAKSLEGLFLGLIVFCLAEVTSFLAVLRSPHSLLVSRFCSTFHYTCAVFLNSGLFL